MCDEIFIERDYHDTELGFFFEDFDTEIVPLPDDSTDTTATETEEQTEESNDFSMPDITTPNFHSDRYSARRLFVKNKIVPCDFDVAGSLEILEYLSEYVLAHDHMQNTSLITEMTINPNDIQDPISEESKKSDQQDDPKTSITSSDEHISFSEMPLCSTQPSDENCTETENLVDKSKTDNSQLGTHNQTCRPLSTSNEINKPISSHYSKTSIIKPSKSATSTKTKLNYDEYNFEEVDRDIDPDFIDSIPANILTLVEQFTISSNSFYTLVSPTKSVKISNNMARYARGYSKTIMRNWSSCAYNINGNCEDKDEKEPHNDSGRENSDSEKKKKKRFEEICVHCANSTCGKWEAFPKQFVTCARCKRARYCDQDCYVKSWDLHLNWCQVLSSSSEEKEQEKTASP